MVGCGWYEDQNEPGSWTCRVITADRLTETEESRILGEWLDLMKRVCESRRCALADARLSQWSNAEVSFLETAYNSAAERATWPDRPMLPWVDLLKHVAHTQPLTGRGAFGFGLKAVAKAMKRAGLMETEWGDGPADGLGAMAGAWWCDAEARRSGKKMPELDLMRSIEAYNRIDVKVVAELLSFLRRARSELRREEPWQRARASICSCRAAD